MIDCVTHPNCRIARPQTYTHTQVNYDEYSYKFKAVNLTEFEKKNSIFLLMNTQIKLVNPL